MQQRILDLSILCICFNRRETSVKLFRRLEELGFREIYLSIDGPRNSNDKDIQNEIINYAQKCFDKVHINLLCTNYGVSRGPVKALDWFFTKTEFGIILEDDIIPTKAFFDFIYEMYSKYDGVEKILTINGGSYSTIPERLDLKYYFSSYVHIWGWATWSHVWKNYTIEISKHDIDFVMNQRFWYSSFEKNYWRRNMYKDFNVHWDFQLSFLSFKMNALNITPTRTLTKNIGFRQSSHEFLSDPIREREAFDGTLPQVFPSDMQFDSLLDYKTYREMRSYNLSRILRLLKYNGLYKISKFGLKKLVNIYMLKP
jgi:hypothetical protein